MTPTLHLAPAGAHNFRDLGGLRTRSGSRVKDGVLFRSGDLSALLPDGVRALQALGISAIFDFRSGGEREKRPYSWRDGYHYWSHDYEMSGASLSEFLAIGDVERERVREAMRVVYRDLPFLMAPAYRALFSAIAHGRTPLIFGCTAGKDRTGMAAAILLSLLDVPWDDIAADYRATDRCIAELRKMAAKDLQMGPHSDQMLAVLLADTDYLQAGFQAIDRECGTIDAYVADVLQISHAQIDAIRENVLS